MLPTLQNSREVKTAAQQRRAILERQANLRAKVAGVALPHPNPWEELMDKLPEGSSPEAHMRWIAELAKRSAPSQSADESTQRQRA